MPLRHKLSQQNAATASTWRAALKWRRTTIIAWISAVALPVAASLYFSLPNFVASAEVLLPLAAPTVDPKTSADLVPETFIDGQVKLLESDRILQKVIDRIGLWQDPEISEHTAPPGGVLAGSSVVPKERDGHRNARIAALRQRLEVASLTPAPAIRVSYTSADPDKAAAVATAVVEEYIETYTAELGQDARQAESQQAQRLARLQERAAAAAQAATERPMQENDPSNRHRQLETALKEYCSLYSATLEDRAEGGRGTTSASREPLIVSAATASRDNSSSLTIMALALGIGGLIGVGSAIRREVVNRPVRSSSDLSASLGVPSLGSVPLVSGRKLFPTRTNASPLLLHDDQDHLRALLLRLRRGTNESRPSVLGVASALGGEGKSTIAFNLAVLAAENGERVLLADMDLHNCTLTKALTKDGESRLLDAIHGSCDLQDAITQTEHGFDVLGQRTLDDGVRPVAVLASQEMEALLAQARKLYDIVICDLPPTLDHADIGTMADTLDCFVFVAEWGRTPAPALEYALQHSPAVESRRLGALLNKAPPRS